MEQYDYEIDLPSGDLLAVKKFEDRRLYYLNGNLIHNTSEFDLEILLAIAYCEQFIRS